MLQVYFGSFKGLTVISIVELVFVDEIDDLYVLKTNFLDQEWLMIHVASLFYRPKANNGIKV